MRCMCQCAQIMHWLPVSACILLLLLYIWGGWAMEPFGISFTPTGTRTPPFLRSFLRSFVCVHGTLKRTAGLLPWLCWLGCAPLPVINRDR